MNKETLLAPNGAVSNLTSDLWHYVRTPEFKAWFGDWENNPDSSSRVVDSNGEPLLVWHGSNADFDEFDLSKGGRNTGGGEWVDTRNGGKLHDDTSRAIFFCPNKELSCSYSLLAQHNENLKLYNWAQDMIPFFRIQKNYGFKNRGEFISAMDSLSAYSIQLKEFAKIVHSNPDIVIVKLMSEHPEINFASIGEEMVSVRDIFQKRVDSMRCGQMSNAHLTYTSQVALVKSLIDSMDRLRANDRSVKNNFGTFEEYDCTICGSGNKTLSISYNHEIGRMQFIGEGKRIMLDEASDSQIQTIKDLLCSYTFDGIKEYNNDLLRLGFNDNAHLYGCFINVRAPFEHDYCGSSMMDRYKETKYPSAYIAARQVNKAITDGCDGVIYQNVRDPFLSDSYGVFNSRQIQIVKHECSLFIEKPIFLNQGRRAQLQMKSEMLFQGSLKKDLGYSVDKHNHHSY